MRRFSIVLLLIFFGCAKPSQLRGRLDALDDMVRLAQSRGAYDCAPRELALAKSNVEFARSELAQGNAVRAEEHLSLAEPNAQAALTLSPPGRCAKAASGDADGDGILDDVDECPNEPEDFDSVQDEDGCPDDQDTDGDGISDSRDLCVLEKEDTDGYIDSDGCPEPDNDLDKIVDDQDRCANEPEDLDGHQDADGCPDLDNDADTVEDVQDDCPNEPGPVDTRGCPRVYKDVKVTKEAIKISQKIYFATNRAVIRERSYGLLNTVAQVLNDYPDVTIEIQGHTDSRGRDSYNQRLSQNRAEAVLAYLRAQGIDSARMTARGYGETQPIDSNRTRSGREANRRVEFVRTDTKGGTP